MSCWDTLAIAPTTDLKLIKKAYAKLLKQIDQETDPHAFMVLRDAFEHAKYEAQYILSDEDDSYFDDVAQDNHLGTNDENLVQNLDHMDGLIEDLVNKHSVIESLDVENRVTDDTSTIIENLYHNLEQQLQLKNQYFNLYSALADIRIQLEQLDIDTQADYVQRFKSLLAQYELDGFQDQLIPSQSPLVEKNEDLHTEIFEESKSYSSQHTVFLNDTNHAYSKTDSDSEFEEETEFLEEPVQDQFYQDLEQIVVSIQAQDFSKDQFQRFEQLITQINDYSFEQQLDFKERVMYAFLSVDTTHYQADFFPFISLWQQYFPPEDDCLNQDYYAGQVQELTEFYQRQVQIYQQLKPSNQTAYLQLVEDQPFQPWRMLLLNGELSKQFKTSDYLDELQIANRASNANFLYLDSIRHWRQELWLIVVISLGSLYYFNAILHVPAVFKVLLVVVCVLYYFFIQLPIKARLLAHPNSKRWQLRLNQVWFVSGIALITATSYINNTLHQSLTYLWLLLAVFVFSTASTVLPNAVKRFFAYPEKIVADKWVMLIPMVLLGLIFGLFATNDLRPNLLLSFAFIAIPANFLFFPEYFQSMYRRFSFQPYKDQDITEDADQETSPSKRSEKVINFFSVAAVGGGLFALLFWFTDIPSGTLSLVAAILCYFSILLLAVRLGKVPYVYKYICYVCLITITVFSVFIPLYLLYYLYHTGREDLQEYREQRQA